MGSSQGLKGLGPFVFFARLPHHGATQPPGASGSSLDRQGVDTSTPSGKVLFQMLGGFAEFERS